MATPADFVSTWYFRGIRTHLRYIRSQSANRLTVLALIVAELRRLEP
jgi:hypothetical protein